MTEKIWSLKEIREAYGEILKSYNTLYPLHPQTKMEHEEIIGSFDFGRREDDNFYSFLKKAKEILPKLREAADRSGNAVTWHRGDPLDGLSQSMRERIEKDLKLGI